MKRGHLTAIRRMARELNRWCAAHSDGFWHNGVEFNQAGEEQGMLRVRLRRWDKTWTIVNLATARFTDRKGNDLMAIQ